MRFTISIKDINKLSPVEVVAIYTRLSWPDSQSDSSMRPELHKRYMTAATENHPEMAIATIWEDDVLIGWVGSRPWPEKFKGDNIIAQTVECFIDPEFRRRGFAKLGLQALIAAKKINPHDFVAVYSPEVVTLAEKCGCRTVLFCETKR